MNISIQPCALVDPTAYIGNPKPAGTQVSQLGTTINGPIISSFVSLQDGRGTAPHRRVGFSVRDVLGTDPRCNQLEVLFDQAFAVPVHNRFETCDELASRLANALKPAGSSGEDPWAVIMAAEQYLQLHDRKTQLARARTHLSTVWNGIAQYVGQKFTRPSVFTVALGQMLPAQKLLPQGFDLIGYALSLTVNLAEHQLSRQILFGFASKGAGCALLRMITAQPERTAADASGSWKELFWFNPEPNMALDMFLRAVDDSVILAVRELEQEVMRSQP